MIKHSLLLFLSLLLSTTAFTQGNPKIKPKSFFITPEGVEKTKAELKIAEKYYRQGHGAFDEALKHYLKVYSYNPKSPELNYKIGTCYLWTSDKKASLKYLLESTPEVSEYYYLALGRAYQYNHQFNKAKDAYSNFYNSLKGLKKKSTKKLVTQLKRECDISASLVKDSLPVFITNLGPIVNSYYDDYAAILSNNDSILCFTSKRPKKEPHKRVSRFKFKEQILFADNNGVDTIATQVFSAKEINGKANTSVAGFSNNEEKIYVYKGLINNGRILSYIKDNGKWKHPKKLAGINHIAFRETSVSFDNDGTAYFCTTRRGGYGGKDIWVAKHKKKNKYYKPVNIGNIINTPFDEEGVYITPDGNTLFFSSKGHKGMGGFDIYKSTCDNNGTWSLPANLGYPINTPADELFYHPTKDSLVAIFSTIRRDGYGGLDIYKIKKDTRIPFTLKGTVKDVETGNVIPANVNVYNLTTQKILKSTVVDTTTHLYELNFDDRGNYMVQVDYDKYKSVSKNITCPKKRNSEINMDFSLELMKHPFTLLGTVNDVDNDKPLKASLTFSMALSPDSVIARTVSVDSTGRYSVTFDDKYNLIIHAEADDYFAVDSLLNTSKATSNVIIKNLKLKRSKIEYTLTGIISDEQTAQPVNGYVRLYNPGEKEPLLEVNTDSLNGKYIISIDEAGPFMVEVAARGYFYIYDVFSFPENETVVVKNFSLKKMNTGVKMVINNILFNSGKATLKPSSFPTLDKLADLLKKNPDVKIEVSGHTDNIGSAAVNKRLSKQRALAVKNYLVSRGIEQNRIVAEGYGFEQPIASNETAEGRAQNRRVELKILNSN